MAGHGAFALHRPDGQLSSDLCRSDDDVRNRCVRTVLGVCTDCCAYRSMFDGDFSAVAHPFAGTQIRIWMGIHDIGWFRSALGSSTGVGDAIRYSMASIFAVYEKRVRNGISWRLEQEKRQVYGTTRAKSLRSRLWAKIFELENKTKSLLNPQD